MNTSFQPKKNQTRNQSSSLRTPGYVDSMKFFKQLKKTSMAFRLSEFAENLFVYQYSRCNDIWQMWLLWFMISSVLMAAPERNKTYRGTCYWRKHSWPIRSSLMLNRPKPVALYTCKYLIIHSPQGFSGIIYNTGWGTLPDCLRCSLQVLKEWMMMNRHWNFTI